MLKKDMYAAITEMVRAKPQLSEGELEEWVARRFGSESLLGWLVIEVMVDEGVLAVDEQTGQITVTTAGNHEDPKAS